VNAATEITMTHAFRSTLLMTLALVLCGCGTPASKVPPGASVTDATGALGQPTGEYALAGGGKRLEYATGPSGRQTWMLDFDAGGRLLSTTQVLTENNFNAMRLGMSGDEVRLALGRPNFVRRLPRVDQTVWTYRFEHPFCLWFQVGLDPSAKVVATNYGSDPICTPQQDK
jgi:hypothetical protein